MVLDKVRVGNKLIALRLRDKWHAYLEAILVENGLLDTAEALEVAFMGLTRGMGYTLQEIDRVRGHNTTGSDALNLLITLYNVWHDECKRKHLSPIMCKRVIIEGYSLNDVDKEYGMREGTCKKNMLSCLRVFAELRKA